MRFLPAADTAMLVELDDLAHTMALYRNLQGLPIAGVQELVPAARTLLVHFRPAAITQADLIAELRERAALAAVEMQESARPAGRLVEIPVHYNGEDLPEVAERLGISTQEVIARHTGQPWLAAFAGFAPGFVYLAEGHPSFRNLARRRSPRTRVPAGSVALAGDFSAVYPKDSPGGWQLIGVTDIAMWNLQRPEPAYVQPGFRVQFRDAVAGSVHISLPSQTVAVAASPSRTQAMADPNASTIEFLDTGLQTLVQDAGRHGMSGLGISPSGALDAPAMRQANRLVGNPVDTPVLENVLGRLKLRCHGKAVVAVTGAETRLQLQAADGRNWPVSAHQAVALDDGDTLLVEAPSAGVRCYVAARGGWDITPVLGSCSTDTLAQVGPPMLVRGDRVAVGATVPAEHLQATAAADPDARTRPDLPKSGDCVTLDVVMGPRTDWFTAEALQRFSSQEWRVTPQSNRIGMRLEGEHPLPRCRHDELPSEGTICGAIQVPISGQPVLFLADHPLTGGYPVIAGIASHHLALAAQIPVGCRVRFNIIAPFSEPA